MARAVRSRGFLPVRSRRKNSWQFGPAVQAAGTIVLSASGSAILGVGAQAVTDGMTLVRLRGNMRSWLSTLTSAFDGFSGAFGIGVFQEEAFAIGVTAVPSPETDIGWDGWIWWTGFTLRPQSVTADTAAFRDYVIDSKSMRKLDTGDVIALVVEVREIGGSTINFQMDSRALVKLA